MEIPNNVIESFVQNTVKHGDVFVLELDKQDGIVPKGDDVSRNKFLVVLGFDNDGNVYGGVIINSRINQKNESISETISHAHKSDKIFRSYDTTLSSTVFN